MQEDQREIAGLRTVVVGTAAQARIVVVMLHGFAMDPGDLAPFAHSISVPAWFLFPEGPFEASPRGRAWWHIDPTRRAESLASGPRDFATVHPPDLPAARDGLSQFLRVLDPEVGQRPLVLGGFSQGGMLACDTMLHGTHSFQGMVLLSSSRIAFAEWQPCLAGGRVKGIPVLVSHGSADADLSFEAGQALRDCLITGRADVTWIPFDQGHEIPLIVWRGLRKFLSRLMNPG